MGKIVAVASQKGGVGKTTTAINLGTSFAILERKTLIIDLDPQGSVAASFQLNEVEVEKGMFQVFSENIPLSDALIDIGLEDLHIVPSNVDGEDEEIEFFRYAMNYDLLRHILAPYKDLYDYILLDCPPSLGSITINAIAAADSILVPVQCEYYSMRALGKFIRSVKQISQNHNPQLKFMGFLITMQDKRVRKSQEIEQKLRHAMRDIVMETTIPRNASLAEAPSLGKPAALFDITSAGAIGYLQLAEEIVTSNSNHV
jgi:chromosome partitioning protein